MTRSSAISDNGGNRPPDSRESADMQRLDQALREMSGHEPLRLRVSGQCMEPTIPDDGEIVVERAARYWPGDVVAFRSAVGDLRAHRLVGYRWAGGRFLAQTIADATGTIDRPVQPGKIIGKVIGVPTPYRPHLLDRVAALLSFVRLRFREAVGR